MRFTTAKRRFGAVLGSLILCPSRTSTISITRQRLPSSEATVQSVPGVGYYWPRPWTLASGVDGQAALFNPSVQIIRSVMWQAQSYYNGLQVKLDKRLSRGFQVQGSYTWGKSIDNSSGSAAADTFTNEWNALPFYDLRLVRGLSAYNIGRNLVISGLWNGPAATSLGSFGRPVLGGWQLGLITSVSDGVPILPCMGMDA